MTAKKSGNHGFTLLEILIVVVILGALAALAIPAYTATTEKAKKQEAFMALAAVREAQQRYYIANTSYANAFSSLDFDPSTSLTGQTPIFTYTVGTTTDASHWTAKASRTGNSGAGGAYTVQINEVGTITSNF